ncbi:LysR family transcriptional regulator [Vibrio sp. 99-8-1]|uniref:LysR substrate-binding domain-containing protein n=1 Tax=Vibrio sp. 99-8-1 TaxID=2607602 RepID=UPI001493A370|nr:LysR family transcriptional regulator [Vibrio sp. 99-8-1]
MVTNQFEWDDLRVFLAIYRGRSVRSAARIMEVSHSTISRRLQAMEEQMERKLFLRHQNGFILTETGEAMVERAERVETEILSMQREVFGKDSTLAGVIRITAIPQIVQHLLMPCVKEFSLLYPEIDLQIDSSYQLSNLSRHDADVAIRVQKQPDDHLIGRRLPDLASAVYATEEYTKEHRFTGQSPTAQWVGWIANGKEMDKWHNKTPFRNCSVKHRIYDPVSHVQAIKHGLGFSILFCFVGDNDEDLVRVKGQQQLKSSPCWILSHPDVFATERVRIFVRFLHNYLTERKARLSGEATTGTATLINITNNAGD